MIADTISSVLVVGCSVLSMGFAALYASHIKEISLESRDTDLEETSSLIQVN